MRDDLSEARLNYLVVASHRMRGDPLYLAMIKAEAYTLSRKPDRSGAEELMLELINILIDAAEDRREGE